MSFVLALPEIFVLVMACIILLVDLFTRQKEYLLTYVLTQLTLIGVVLLNLWLSSYPQGVGTGFEGQFVRDSLSTVLEIAIASAGFITFLFSRRYILSRGNMARGEYYTLGLFSLLGMMVLVSSESLLTLYLGLELLSLPLYAMVAMHRDNGRAIEAAMKFFVMGAIASGMLLYGMSLIYGVTQSIQITEIAAVAAHSSSASSAIFILGIVFIVAGIAFKLGAAPFHMWLPDVFEGSPASVTLFIGTAPKLAGFGMAIRLLVDMLPALQNQWQPLLIFLAIASMAIGNFLAIAQTNIKRMLAYSSVAHMGYMLLGLIAGTPMGYGASLFYMISYVFMSSAGLAVLVVLSRENFECENITDLQGLNSRNPWLAFLMLLVVFSMAGLPPLIGFFAKLGVLEALISVHLVWLAVLAIVFAIIGLYYYLRVVKVMYFDRPMEAEPILWGGDTRVMLTLNSFAVLFFGIFPGGLFVLSHFVFSA